MRCERDLMIEHFGATGQKALISRFLGRLLIIDNLTSATSSKPVGLNGGDKIPSLTTESTSEIQSDRHNPIFEL